MEYLKMNHEFLKQLKSITGTKDKINTLNKMMSENEHIARFFNMALNPYKNYGIKVLPEYTPSGTYLLNEMLFDRCENLSKMNHSNESIELVKSILSNAEYPEIWAKLILKNPDCGINIANFNKALPDNLKEKYQILDFPCMLVSSDVDKVSAKFDWEKGIYCQTKMDGMRCAVIVSEGGKFVEFYGRSGKPITILSKCLKNEFKRLGEVSNKDLVFDGELLVKRNGKILDRKTGNGILNKCIKSTISEEESELICITLWDVIPKDLFVSQNYKKYDSEIHQYSNRFNYLKELMKISYNNTSSRISLVDSKIVHSMDEAYEIYNQKISEGEEGVILKDPATQWKNTRSTTCVKLKEIKDCDLKVTDWVEGTGKYSGQLGAVVCQSSDGKLVVSVGSGFNEEERKTITKESILDKIITIQYNMIISDKNTGVYSLFLPRFVEIRENEKTEADSLEKIINS